MALSHSVITPAITKRQSSISSKASPVACRASAPEQSCNDNSKPQLMRPRPTCENKRAQL
eukprot:1666215-Amphidinium_carterae.1